MISNYLKIAWRNLLKHKSTSFINITGLAIGMAVAMSIGLWMYDELTYNTYHKHYERLAQVYVTQTFSGKANSSMAVSIPSALALKKDFASDFQDVALASWNFDHVLSYGHKKFRRQGMFADPSLPRMLSLEMLSGVRDNALTDPYSILLSDDVARTIFGDEDPMGKAIKIDNRHDVRVTGIFKDLPRNSEFYEVKYYLPWEFYLLSQEWVKGEADNWSNHSFQAYVHLAENADIESVSSRIRDLELNNLPEEEKLSNPQMFLHPMSKWHLHSEFKDGVNIGGRVRFVRLFGIIGAFVLLLACINFMNLSTARSERRSREVGIRKAIGSVRGQLVTQFLSESFFIVTIALALSLAMVQLSLPWFNRLSDKQMHVPIAEPMFWISLFGFAAITGLIAGSYPAFYLSSFQPLKVLKGTFKAGKWASVPRQVLVTLQFTVSIALIIGTLVVFNQIQHAKNRPVGYDRQGLLQTNITSDITGKFDALRNALLETNMVEEAAQSSGPATGIWANLTGFKWEGMDTGTEPLFAFMACSHEFGKTVSWDLKEGRDFSREFSTDSSAFVVNEKAVELIGIENIVGKTIRWNDNPMQIIGVVEDLVMESPYQPVRPMIFWLNYNWASVIHVKLKPEVPLQDALASVEKVFTTFDPASPFDYQFVDDRYDEKFRAEERVGKLARVFAFLAIFISCLGLFGLSAYVAERRTKEIGIRKVLGASVMNLWAQQSRGFVFLVLVACVIAIPLARLVLGNWLSEFTYRIPLRWEVFLLAGVLAVVVALVTVSFQSIKAALNNPVQSLRSE